MSGSMRLILREAGLWVAVFVAALGCFAFLDGHLDTLLGKREAWSQSAAPSEQRDAAPAPATGAEPQSEAEADPAAEPEEETEQSSPGRVVLRAGASGHFQVKAYINNRPVDLMADTGATYVVLSWEDARSLGVTGGLDFSGTAHTANGTSRVAPVTLDKVEVGDIRLTDVKAIVTEQGALDTSLLGMSFIGRLQSFQMSGKKLILEN